MKSVVQRPSTLKQSLQAIQDFTWDIPPLRVRNPRDTERTPSKIAKGYPRWVETMLRDQQSDVPARPSSPGTEIICDWQALKADVERHEGRELTDQESESRHQDLLRTLAIRQHFDRFQALSVVCQEFVTDLTDAGRQSLLGIRAGLEPAEPAARRCSHIEFKPRLLPGEKIASQSEYEDRTGGPHAFGACLLWWCAAVRSPREFGYSDDHLTHLWQQPFWFDIHTNPDQESRFTTTLESISHQYELCVAKRPLRLLQEAAQFVATAEINAFTLAAPTGKASPPQFGFHGHDLFWEGRPISFGGKDTLRDLARLVLNSYPHSVDKAAAIDVVWGGDFREDKSLSSSCRRINDLFLEKRVPLEVCFRLSRSIFELEYLGQGPNPLDPPLPSRIAAH
jgi:hypothetical protein